MICTICRMPVESVGFDWRGEEIVACVGYDACGAEWNRAALEGQQHAYSLTDHDNGPRRNKPGRHLTIVR